MTETQAADQMPSGGEPLTDFTWEPWTPQEVATRLAGVDVPWAFAAGWALELFRGAGGREHEDVEIAVPIASFAAIQKALEPYEFEIVGSESKW